MLYKYFLFYINLYKIKQLYKLLYKKSKNQWISNLFPKNSYQILWFASPNSIDLLAKFNRFPFKISGFLFNFKGIPTKLYGLPPQIQ